MAEKTVKVSVRLPADIHHKVRIRAFEERTSLDALARGWFEAYANKTKRSSSAR